MTKKYVECVKFLTAASNRRITKDEKGEVMKSPPIKTKFDYALDRTSLKVKKAIEVAEVENMFQDKTSSLANEHASTSKEGQLLYNQNGTLQMTPQKKNELNKKINEETKKLNETEIEFENYISTFIPENLSLEEIEIFKGFVLPEDYEYEFKGDIADNTNE